MWPLYYVPVDNLLVSWKILEFTAFPVFLENDSFKFPHALMLSLSLLLFQEKW